ncbi:phenylacetate--CoA ligase family protein [Anaerocolumna xylanovorans]|uniref:Phenylacetate-CoA ligase n=1 Tax=Anaerocolumna xylanovorans DSM 12503 TaxID=1121345 RepID=A0A1M7Y1Q1_9FIRM|nr:phenylacetate--CoA ligase family protein [Anaerocolumna xylanovorans]SHO45691.1 phenylacetate-CoA ligase [Anaerocolumna xylanovorans DSM 12503]
MKEYMLLMYYRLPVPLQNLAVSLYGLLLYQQRYRGVYKKYLKLYSKATHRDAKKEQKIQDKKFIRLLHYAVKNSPFYREFYKNIPWEEITSAADIVKLPVLSKDTLRDNIKNVYTIPKRRSITFYTGGTTGIPLGVRKRKIDVRKRMAYLDAYKLTFGVRNNKMRSARFFGKKILEDNPKKPIFWRNNYIGRQRFYSTYHLTEKNLPYYVADLNRYKPAAIDGFVSAIYTVAKYMEDNGIKPSFKPKAVFTTSETVLPFYRETIEKVFGCPLTDQYASNEGAPFIIQCRCGSYHEAIDTGIFEHLPAEGGMKLLVTGFDTFGTPLIRYDIGDRIIPADKDTVCPCHSSHPVIEGISGREAAFLVTAEGRVSEVQLSVFVSSLLKTVNQMQFIQKKDGGVHVLCIPVGKDTVWERERILAALRQFFGPGTKITLEVTDSLCRQKSGKFQLIRKEE